VRVVPGRLRLVAWAIAPITLHANGLRPLAIDPGVKRSESAESRAKGRPAASTCSARQTMSPWETFFA